MCQKKKKAYRDDIAKQAWVGSSRRLKKRDETREVCRDQDQRLSSQLRNLDFIPSNE